MNRILTTAGLAALGAMSMTPASAQELITDQKPWAIGAQLRGFYDDNYLTYPKALRDLPGFDDNTFGFDVSPHASYNLKRDQTTLGLSYLYSLRYFVDREDTRDDHSHQANLKLTHVFNERYSVDLKDSFVVAQEPSILDPTISTTVPARSEGDNFRNTAGVQFNASLLEHFGIVLGYNNSIYDYEQDAADIAAVQAAAGFPVTGEGSRSAVLDRMEHEISIDGNYQIMPRTTLSLGYIYTKADYRSDDPLFVDPVAGTFLPGSIRDKDSHVVTLGARQQVNPQLVASAKAGVEITAYDASNIWDDDVSPYGEASASWNYAEGSALQLGVRHRRVATDVRVLPGAAGINSDAEATSVFLSVTHQIAAKILVNAMAQYQHAEFNGSTGGGDSDVADNLFYGGVTFTYQFTRNVAAELGYTYDRLDSDIGLRSFTRNRVFAGTRLSF
jgi:hypothetical protein